MRINMDCIRDILLCVEQNAGFPKFCMFYETETVPVDPVLFEPPENLLDYQIKLQESYANDVLFYHLRYCIEAGLVKTHPDIVKLVSAGHYCASIPVHDLTVSGHELIAKIRDASRWSGIKKSLPAIRNYSLDAINALSQGMTSAAITAYLSKNP